MNLTFCPQAIKWGDVATWMAAMGSLAAVCTALVLAKRDKYERNTNEKRVARLLAIRLRPALANVTLNLEIIVKNAESARNWPNINAGERDDFIKLVKSCPIDLFAFIFSEKVPKDFEKISASLARAHGLLSSAVFTATCIEEDMIEKGKPEKNAANLIITFIENAKIHLNYAAEESRLLHGAINVEPWINEKRVPPLDE